MIKIILIDLFGVLYENAWKKWLEEHKISLKKFAENEPPFIEKGLTPTYPQYYYDLIRLNTDEKKLNNELFISDEIFYHVLEEASNMDKQFIREILHDTSKLNKDIVSVLNICSKHGFRLGLIANGDRDIVDEFLNSNNLKSLFCIIINSAEVGHKKPHPAMFEKISLCLNLKLSEMLLIDDSQGAVLAVKDIGIASINYYGQNRSLLLQEIEEVLGESLASLDNDSC